MSKYFIAMSFILLAATSSTAATWNVFHKAYNDELMFFFDADTVVKKGDTVTMWTKSVNNDKHPDEDGSYARAEKSEYSCKKRTRRVLTISTYDKEGKFISSYEPSGKTNDIIPDSLGEDLLKASCTSDFPRSKSKDLYSTVEGNNIFKYASNYYKSQAAIKTDLAPTSVATWYVFNHAVNDYKVYFFDINTITTTGNNVSVWVKYVNNVKHPDNDGSYSTATKIEFDCSKNTVQYLNSSIYNKEAKFIRAYIKPEDTVKVEPNSINEAMSKAVCSQDFAKSSSREEYFSVEGNDIYELAANYYKSQEAKLIDEAPK